jgi:hypothetical protein
MNTIKLFVSIEMSNKMSPVKMTLADTQRGIVDGDLDSVLVGDAELGRDLLLELEVFTSERFRSWRRIADVDVHLGPILLF